MKNDEQISIKEAIHIFENSRLTSANFTPEAVTAAYVLALAALQEKAESPWINVKNKLPKEGKEVLVYAVRTLANGQKYGEIAIDFVAESGKYFYHNYPYVTHWTPLPEAPEEVTDNE